VQPRSGRRLTDGACGGCLASRLGRGTYHIAAATHCRGCRRKTERAHYYLLNLDTINNHLLVREFKREEYEVAQTAFYQVEELVKGSPGRDVVLVAVDSVAVPARPAGALRLRVQAQRYRQPLRVPRCPPWRKVKVTESRAAVDFARHHPHAPADRPNTSRLVGSPGWCPVRTSEKRRPGSNDHRRLRRQSCPREETCAITAALCGMADAYL
jgi:hypothetical protein